MRLPVECIIIDLWFVDLDRLCLPGELVEDGQEKAEHDIDKGLTILICVLTTLSANTCRNCDSVCAEVARWPVL